MQEFLEKLKSLVIEFDAEIEVCDKPNSRDFYPEQVMAISVAGDTVYIRSVWSGSEF